MKRLLKKRLFYVHIMVLSLCLSPINNIIAQVSVGVQISVPVWAPHYTDVRTVQYYYLPDIEVYYDVWSNQYVYLDNGVWIYSSVLPPAYAHYDLHRGHVVVLERGIHNPWMRHHSYVSYYPKHYFHGKPRKYYVERSGEHKRSHKERVVAPRRSMSDNVPQGQKINAPRSSSPAPSHQQGGKGKQHHEKAGRGNSNRPR